MTTASGSSAASLSRRSVEIDQVEDESHHTRDISPSNASLLFQSLDGSDDNRVEAVGGTRSRSSSIININDDSSEDMPVETDDAECGMIHKSIGNHILTVCYRSSPLERMECADLCLLPPCPIDRLCREPSSTSSCLRVQCEGL